MTEKLSENLQGKSPGIQRAVLRDAVEEIVVQRLSAGEWPPGKSISIEGLARELSVSPTPVREALISLERSRLVKYRALKGYVVAAPLNEEQIAELIDARYIIESAALSRAMTAEQDQLTKALRQRHDAHERAALTALKDENPPFKAFADYYAADFAFHNEFFAHANNKFLKEIQDSLGAHTHRMRQTWQHGEIAYDFDHALAEHKEILLKVEQRNHDGAMLALQQHLENVKRRSLEG